MRILILLVVLGIVFFLVKQQLEVNTPPASADSQAGPVPYGSELEKTRAVEDFMREHADERLRQADELTR